MKEAAAHPPQQTFPILDAIPGAHVLLLPNAPTFTIIAVSDDWLTVTAAQRQDILGQSLFDIIPDELRLRNSAYATGLLSSLSCVLENQSQQVMQCIELRSVTGHKPTLKIFKPFNRPVFDGNGEVQYIIHSLEDITSYQLTSARLEKEQAKLAEVQAIGAIGSFEWQTGDEYITWSDELYRIHGMEPQSKRITIGHTDNLFFVEDRLKVLALKNQSLVTPGGYEITHRILLDDGSVKFVIHRFESCADENGNIIRVHGTVQDVTERRIAEIRQEYSSRLGEALRPIADPFEVRRTAMKLLGEYLGLDGCGYGEIDESQQFLIFLDNYCTEEVSSLTGQLFLDAFGENIIDILRVGNALVIYDAGADPRLTHPLLAPAFASIEITAAVVVPLIKMSDLVAALFAHQSKARTWTPVEIEIIEETAERTWSAIERARAEEAIRKTEDNYRSKLEKEVEERTVDLRKTNLSLQKANENLKQFASIASHDLQEPLRKLGFFASLLKRHYNVLPEGAQELLNKITNTSERMRRLISEILKYSKVAYGAKEFTETDLDQILQVVLTDLELRITETNTTIDYPTPLPGIVAMPTQMNQLISNLLTNTLKFRREGVCPVIHISHRELPINEAQCFSELDVGVPHLEILFSDNGIGFEQVFADQIFRIFERLHSVEEFEGTGVGLALCKKIADNHHGHIYAKSAENCGASFYILLPTIQRTGDN